MESPRIGSSQAAMLEDAQPLDFSDVSKNSWELRVSTEEIIAERFEIHDVTFCGALLVCLSKALAFLKISSGSEMGVAGDPFGFEATLYQWSFQIDDYNCNNV